MTVRWYVMPAELVQVNGRTVRRPQFIGGTAAVWGWMPVSDGWGVGWADLSAANHTNYIAQTGVRFITADLSSTVDNVATFQTALDNRNLPFVWVTGALSWHDAIKRTLAFLLCIQRYWGSQKVGMGTVRDSLVTSLPQTAQAGIAEVAATMGLPPPQAGDTVGDALMRFSDTWMTRQIFVGGIEL